MSRLPAAFFAFAACGLWGFLAADRLRNRTAVLEGWENVLLRAKNAVEGGGLSLPQILRFSDGGKKGAFSYGAECLENDPSLSPDTCFALLPLEKALNSEETALLKEAVKGLFDFPVSRQLLALNRVLDQWRERLLKEKEKSEKNAGLFRRLGILAGAAAFILLC